MTFSGCSGPTDTRILCRRPVMVLSRPAKRATQVVLVGTRFSPGGFCGCDRAACPCVRDVRLSASVSWAYAVQTGRPTGWGWPWAARTIHHTRVKQHTGPDGEDVVTGTIVVTRAIINFAAVKCKSQHSRFISAHCVARFDDHFTLILLINNKLCQRYSRSIRCRF